MSDALLMPQRTANEELVDLVLERILERMPLREAVKGTRLTASGFLSLVSGVRDLSLRYMRAMEHRADLWNEQIIEIVNDPMIDPQRARVMIDALKWTAARAHPKKYADRIDVNVQQSISVAGALTDARARLLRPVSDQQIEDASFTEVSRVDARSDAKPADPPPGGWPDIFS